MKNKRAYAELFLYACVLMLLCAGSSPLIQYLSPDSSIFFTMGRSAAHGNVLYRDIADHKGFYLFAINWLGAWINSHNMNGIFIVEIIFAWVKLSFLYKIAAIYAQDDRKCMLAAMLFMLVSTNFLSWNTGDLGEQFALAFQLISLYYMARYAEENRQSDDIVEHRPVYMMIHGLCAGVVFFIQANLIAMWIPFGIGLTVVLFRKGYVRNFFCNLGYLLAGVGITFVPVVLYGVIHHCIDDMYYIMFEVNFMYSADGRSGKSIIGYLKDFIISPSGAIVLLAIIGVVIVCIYYKQMYISVTVSAMLLFSIICMSVSLNANPIYYTVYMPFMLPAFIWLTRYLSKKYFYLECAAILICTVIVNLQMIKKVLRLGSSSYAYESAYQMKPLIEDKDADILVLGNSLYYNCTDTLPHIRYFTTFASGLQYDTFPYCIDEQYNSLCSGENEYVIIQYMNDGYIYWEDEERDARTAECLENEYDILLEYRDGGIHSVLYGKK